VDGPQWCLGTEQRLARGWKLESNGKMSNLGLQEGELLKFSLYFLLLGRWASQGQGNLQMSMKQKQQSNTKENLL